MYQQDKVHVSEDEKMLVIPRFLCSWTRNQMRESDVNISPNIDQYTPTNQKFYVESLEFLSPPKI